MGSGGRLSHPQTHTAQGHLFQETLQLTHRPAPENLSSNNWENPKLQKTLDPKPDAKLIVLLPQLSGLSWRSARRLLRSPLLFLWERLYKLTTVSLGSGSCST